MTPIARRRQLAAHLAEQFERGPNGRLFKRRRAAALSEQPESAGATGTLSRPTAQVGAAAPSSARSP